jgi:hypothetical protein
MGRIKGHMIYKVITTEFLPLRERPLHDPDEDNYLTLLKGLIKTLPTASSARRMPTPRPHYGGAPTTASSGTVSCRAT